MGVSRVYGYARTFVGGTVTGKRVWQLAEDFWVPHGVLHHENVIRTLTHCNITGNRLSTMADLGLGEKKDLLSKLVHMYKRGLARVTNEHNLAWICIHTKPRSEAAVQGGLLDLALETFLPTRRITVPDRTRPGHSCSQTIPLFPRYLFADVHPTDYFSVPSVRGVHAVVQTRSADGYPQFLTVPSAAVTALRKPQPPPLKVGQSLHLKAPYCGLLAIVQSIRHLDSSGQVEVWLHMMQSTRSVSLHYSLIQTEASV